MIRYHPLILRFELTSYPYSVGDSVVLSKMYLGDVLSPFIFERGTLVAN